MKSRKHKPLLILFIFLFGCSSNPITEKIEKFKNPGLSSLVYNEVIDSIGSGYTIIEKEDSIYIVFNSGFDKDSVELYYDSIKVLSDRLRTNYVWGLSEIVKVERSKKEINRLDLIINDSLYYEIQEPNIYNYIHLAVVYDTLEVIYTNKRWTYE